MIPRIGLVSRGPGDFAGGQLGGGYQTANRININGKFLPLLAYTHIHNDFKPFWPSQNPNDCAAASSRWLNYVGN
jgi:hypothetical protein